MIVFLSLIKLALVKYMRQRLKMEKRYSSLIIFLYNAFSFFSDSPVLPEIVPVICTPTAEFDEIMTTTPCNGQINNATNGLKLPRNCTATSLRMNGLRGSMIRIPSQYGGDFAPVLRSNSVQLKSVLVGSSANADRSGSFKRRYSRLSQYGADVATTKATLDSPDVVSIDMKNNFNEEVHHRLTATGDGGGSPVIEFLAAYPKKSAPLTAAAAAFFVSTRCRFTSKTMRRFHWISQVKSFLQKSTQMQFQFADDFLLWICNFCTVSFIN